MPPLLPGLIFYLRHQSYYGYGQCRVEKELEYFGKHKEAVHLGTNASQADYDKITYYEKNNITFALLNYTYGTYGIDLPKDKPGW